MQASLNHKLRINKLLVDVVLLYLLADRKHLLEFIFPFLGVCNSQAAYLPEELFQPILYISLIVNSLPPVRVVVRVLLQIAERLYRPHGKLDAFQVVAYLADQPGCLHKYARSVSKAGESTHNPHVLAQ